MAIVDKKGFWHGTVGDHVYYVRDGKQWRRKRPTPSRAPKTEGMKRKALFAGEFAKAAVAARHLRQALEPECVRVADRYFSQRITSLMMKLKNCHKAPVGSRTCTDALSTGGGKMIFDSFTFHTHKREVPALLDAQVSRGKLSLNITPSGAQGTVIIIQLRINLSTGYFVRYEEELPASGHNTPWVTKKKFCHRKGHTNMVFIAGNNFMQGMVLARPEHEKTLFSPQP